MSFGWLNSYLSNRTCAVTIGSHSSSPTQLAYGVPQGSILGPILFQYICSLSANLSSGTNVSFHCYADDTKIYLPLWPNDPRSLAAVLDCLVDENRWMAHNFLQLFNSKSEIILFNPPTTITSPISLGPLSSNIKPTARNIGVILDSDLYRVVQSCFLQPQVGSEFGS